MMTPRDDFETAFRLHLLGMAGHAPDVLPSYRKLDLRLRDPKVGPAAPDVPWATLDEALLAKNVPDGDREWFESRHAAEIADFPDGRATALLTAIGALGCAPGAAPDPTIGLIVATSLRARPSLAPRARAVGVGPGTAPVLALLGAHALAFAPFFEARFSPAVASFFAPMAAATALMPHLPAEVLDRLVIAAVDAYLPPQHRTGVLAKLVLPVSNSGLLDQPPGEIERLIRGLERRHPDRLHRAWSRGFFVPRMDPPLDPANERNPVE